MLASCASSLSYFCSHSVIPMTTPEDRLDSDETTKLHLDDFSDHSCSSASPLHRPLADESPDRVVREEPLPLLYSPSATPRLSFESVVAPADRPESPPNRGLNAERAESKAETTPVAIIMEKETTENPLATEGAATVHGSDSGDSQPFVHETDKTIEPATECEAPCLRNSEEISIPLAKLVQEGTTETKADGTDIESDDVVTTAGAAETAGKVDVDATTDGVTAVGDAVDDVAADDVGSTTTTTAGAGAELVVAEGQREENSVSDQRSSKESSPVDVTPQVHVASSSSKKQSRADKVRDKKTKRKEDRALDAVTKSLAAMRTPEEKLDVLLKRYSELHEENKTLLLTSKQNERKASVAIREKDQLQLEHSKTVLTKNKLESLCRELQKYNREVKEESLTRAKLEEEKRREIASNFQNSLTDIQEKMTANHETNNALRQENLDLQGKLRGLIEQYEKAQTTVDKVFDRNQEMTKEMERHQKEKELLMLELQQAYKKAELMHEQEKQLRLQLTTYTDKYNEFQTSLQNSNQVFQSFKGEMEKMTKKIKKLEKESLQWKRRAEDANKTLLTMAEEKNKNDKETGVLLLKNKRLEELCRALQSQRGAPPSGEDQNQDADSAPAETVAPTTDANENVAEESPGKDAPREEGEEIVNGTDEEIVNGTDEETTEEPTADVGPDETIGETERRETTETTDQLVAAVS